MTFKTQGWLLAACFSCLLSALTIPIANGAGTAVAFANGRSIDEGDIDPRSVHAADLDLDGDLDIISASYFLDVVHWYENLDGKGNFSEAVAISPCCDREGPRSIATGDVDGDGFPDVVVAFDWTDHVTWFRNTDGLGDFSTGIDIATDANGAAYVVLEDIDGDGDLDVVSASFLDDRVTWYENTDGEGTFAAGLDISTTSEQANALAAADLDADGDIDIVVGSYVGDSVTWFKNSNGNGAFSLGVDLARDTNGTRYVIAVDLDGDEDIDVVSASYFDGRIVWYENTDGAGTFATGVDVGALTSAESVVAADVDNDGDIDLVACDPDGGRIVWYENTDGEASFSSAIDIALDIGVKEVIAVDLDGDGDLDLISASHIQDRLVWYENLLVEDGVVATLSPLSTTEPTPNPVAATSPPVDVAASPAPVAASNGTDPTTAPEATPVPVAGPIEAAPVFPDGSEVIVTTEGGESDHTTEILVAVISSVSGGVILVFITKYCLKEGSAGQ